MIRDFYFFLYVLQKIHKVMNFSFISLPASAMEINVRYNV